MDKQKYKYVHPEQLRQQVEQREIDSLVARLQIGNMVFMHITAFHNAQAGLYERQENRANKGNTMDVVHLHRVACEQIQTYGIRKYYEYCIECNIPHAPIISQLKGELA